MQFKYLKNLASAFLEVRGTQFRSTSLKNKPDENLLVLAGDNLLDFEFYEDARADGITTHQ